MAELNIANQKNRGHKATSLRVDLTPMVDLGFLLIAFFMYTTTLTESKAMDINMPDKSSKAITVFAGTSTITIIPINNHKYLYYYGALTPDENMKVSDPASIRDLLISKQQALYRLPSSFSEDAHKLHVLIKPFDNCKYRDVVELLDEMIINAVPYYVMTDISEQEVQLVTNKLQTGLWK